MVAIFSSLARDGGAPTVFGDGLQTRDYIHVADVVAGILAAQATRRGPACFNIGTGVETDVLKLVDRIGRSPGAMTSSRVRPAARG